MQREPSSALVCLPLASLHLQASFLLNKVEGLRVDDCAKFRPRLLRDALSLLWRKRETRWCCFGAATLEDVRVLGQDPVHVLVERDGLVGLLSLLQRGVLVLLHNLAEEGGINGVKDVQDKLAIALAQWVIGEVLSQIRVLVDKGDDGLLGGVLVLWNAHAVDLVVVEGFLLALEDLD